MNTLTVKAPAISCGHCVHTIESELSELPGITTVKAEQNSKLVTIAFDDPATKEKIEALMEEIGYPVEEVAK
jgi:copper chaperone